MTLSQLIITPSRLKFAALAGVSIGGVLLHLIGVVGHRTYLTTWGLDPGQFPLTLEAALINGFYTSFSRLSVLISALRSPKGAAILGFVIACVWFYFYSRETRPVAKPKPPLVDWRNRWQGTVLKSIYIGTLLFGFAIYSVCISFLVATLPVVAAEAEGAETAKKEQADFKKGCENRAANVRCMELRRGTEVLAKGFVIDSSPTAIAIYNVATQSPITFERAGVTLFGDPFAPTASAGHSSLQTQPQ